MATKGVELASAYISLSVETSQVAGQVRKALSGSTITKDAANTGGRMGTAMSAAMGSSFSGGSSAAASKFMGGFQTEAERRGAKVGTAVGTVVGRSIGGAISLGITGATAGLTAAIGGIGFTLFKGFERYKSLDATSKRLQAMGKTGEQVKTILGDITKVVEGTPIALDEAAGAATKFLSGGVKEGKELNDIMTAIADAAGASGTNFSDLATIFGQVMNKGKLQAEEMNQLNERGINIQALLRDEFKLSGDELTRMSDEGTLSVNHLVQAVEGGFGGMAKKMGDTIDGALGNMQTSVARVGANFISAIFGDPLSTTEGPGGMAEAINRVTTKIDGLNQWVVGHQGDIKEFFTDAAGSVKNLAEDLQGVGSWLVENKETIAFIGTAFAGWKVAGLLGDLGRVGGLLGGAGAGGKGGKGILGQLGLALFLGNQLNNLGSDRGPNDGPDLGSQGIDIASGALFGSMFGPYGTATGAVVGSMLGPTVDYLNPPGPAQNGVLPTAPNSSNVPTVGGIPIPGLLPGQRAPSAGGGKSSGSIFGNAGTGAQPYGLPKGSNSGGYGGTGVQFPDWVSQIGQAFGIKPSTYPGHQENSGLNKGIDWVGPVENMQRFAEYLATIPSMEQVIWNNPNTGMKIGVANGQRVGPGTNQPGYYANDWGGHANHVHTRQSFAIPLPPWAMGYNTGGAARGAGGIDQIPAWLTNGEHVLTDKDVAAMGGQGGVYAFRNALHRNTGGSITWMDFIKTGSVEPGWATPAPTDPKNPKSRHRQDSRSGKDPGNIATPREGWGTPGGGWGAPPPDWWMKPVDPDDYLFPEWWPPGMEGIWKHPYEKRIKPYARGFADGGAVRIEDILALAQQQGVDPNTLQHGMSQGQPGPTPEQMENLAPVRAEGYIPAAAGFTGKTGGGIAGSFINLGVEAINGLIDKAAAAGSMGANAFAPGSGMAIEMGAQAAKRAVQWGGEMAGIGIGAITEILTPFGAPRWLSDVDPTAFMPQWGVQPAAVTSGEKARQDIFAQQAGVVPPGPEQLGSVHGANMGVPPGPVQVPPPPMGAETPGVPGQVQHGAAQGALPGAQPFQPQPNANDPLNFLKMFGFSNGGAVFDNGGILEPNSLGVNLSNRPEYVFTPSQMKQMEANASNGAAGSSGIHIENLTVGNYDEMHRELTKTARRNSRQYSGRP